MKNYSHFLFMIMLIASYGCKHDDDNAEKKSTLGCRPWTFSGIQRNGIDVTSDIPDCKKDDFILFQPDGTLTQDIGALLCFEGEGNSVGTWTFTGNGNMINIHPGDGRPADWKIHELTCESFRISNIDQNTGNEIMITFEGRK